MLTELSKVNAPSLLLSEFNYYINKAINQYVNKRYNIYDVSQQTTDDLRVLKSTAVLTPTSVGNKYDISPIDDTLSSNLFDATFEVTLPDDYLHMLNCICVYKVNNSYKCYDKGNVVEFAAKRLTADSWSIIMNDYYNRPLPERPYFYIHNVNQQISLPTNEYNPDISGSTDTGIVNDSFLKEFPKTIKLNYSNQPDEENSLITKQAGLRHANASKVRCEIRYGRDTKTFELKKVLIDYIKAPQTIRLTKDQMDLTEDTSQIMEFPDYVCQEIINELTLLVMARDSDPRTQIQATVNQSIASPAQQQTNQS